MGKQINYAAESFVSLPRLLFRSNEKKERKEERESNKRETEKPV